jgi:hypothetical protein
VFKVFTAAQQLSLKPGAKSATWSVILRSGRVDVELPNASAQHAVLVSAPDNAGAIVMSGSASVVAANREIVVSSRSGETLSGPGGRWKLLQPGYQRTFSATDPNGEPTPGLPPPQLSAVRRMWFTAQGNATIEGATWRPVAGATAYEVELKPTSGNEATRRVRVNGTRLDRAFDAVPQGIYQLSLMSIDRHGLTSPASAPTTLHVMGIKLPPGAYFDGGVIYLARGQRAELSPVDGIEMSHSGKSKFYPAPDSLSLHRDESTLVLLRARGTSELERLRLEPRGFKAEVTVGPKKAVWPRDPITINIRLKDPTGKPVPSWVKVVPRVQLGLEPIEVKWESRNGQLSATVPPATTPGPWVVRVEVFDQFDIPLGYDFVGIIAEPKKPKGRVQVASR